MQITMPKKKWNKKEKEIHRDEVEKPKRKEFGNKKKKHSEYKRISSFSTCTGRFFSSFFHVFMKIDFHRYCTKHLQRISEYLESGRTDSSRKTAKKSNKTKQSFFFFFIIFHEWKRIELIDFEGIVH